MTPSDEPHPAHATASMQGAETVAQEVRATTRIGLPLALGELGWMSTYIVDALMIGRMAHSALPIAASSLGNTIYYAIVFFMIYLLNGLETFISQAAGRGDRAECVRMLSQSMWIVLLGTPVVMVLTLGVLALLPFFGTPADILLNTSSYLHALIWSTPPLMVYMALRRYLQSTNRITMISLSLILASPVNWFFDWLFLYGHPHVPALGIAGSGWSTVVVRLFMLALLVPAVWRSFRTQKIWPNAEMLKPDWQRLKALWHIGWPSGLQFSLELGISTYMSILCARLGTTLLAAQQVTLDLNAFIYMVPTGFAYAAMIRVGQAAGRKSPRQIRLAGNTALGIMMLYALTASAVFLLFAPRMASLYTNDPAVVQTATGLFHFCAAIILGDTAFVTLESALTGLGDTRTPMIISIACNWLLGMPLAYLLAFHFGMSVQGLWIGRMLANVLAGTVLTTVWFARMRRDRRGQAPERLPLFATARTG